MTPSYLDAAARLVFEESTRALRDVARALEGRTVVLASSSPRRRRMLEDAGLSFVVRPAVIDEVPLSDNHSEDACALACKKALACDAEDVVIAADTVVVIDDEPLGKPASPDHAREMLKRLSGRTHEVITGVALGNPSRVLTAAEKTLVAFKNLSAHEIDAYVHFGAPLDKAGAYGIQEIGERFVERIEGCWYNVVGLPPRVLLRLMRRMES